MDVYKWIVPLRHEGTLNSRRATSLLVRLVERVEIREASDPLPLRVLSLKIGVESSQIVLSFVWCSKLRLTLHEGSLAADLLILTPSDKMTSLARHWFFMPYRRMTSYTRYATKVTAEVLGFGWKRVAINSGPKEPKGHVNEKTREPVTQ
ncbi:hypothetical protein TNCV_2979571 [Trichonephila clavipes]|nr:hypothetical protein TNCV_2979571 [Trichonephila clavipes]